MDLLEITGKERVSREEAAARLRALANALARRNEVAYDRGGLGFKVHVPDEVNFKLEIELQDDEWELEVELTWDHGRPGRTRRRAAAKRSATGKRTVTAKRSGAAKRGGGAKQS